MVTERNGYGGVCRQKKLTDNFVKFYFYFLLVLGLIDMVQIKIHVTGNHGSRLCDRLPPTTSCFSVKLCNLSFRYTDIKINFLSRKLPFCHIAYILNQNLYCCMFNFLSFVTGTLGLNLNPEALYFKQITVL